MGGGLSPAVASVRNGVRAAVAGLADGDLVLAACSGGADSLALAAALAFVAPRAGLRAGAVTVDHGLQDGSADRAAALVPLLGELGLDPVRAVTVTVNGAGGPEAAARTARYTALEKAAADLGAAAVLLGHTLDDQAETVLLGLARGSGPRSLAGMPPARGVFRRPLLGVRRSVTAAACAAQRLVPWDDPHNADRRFARVRVRLDALPALEAALGPGVAEALARTADQLREDAEVMETIAAAERAGRWHSTGNFLAHGAARGGSFPCAAAGRCRGGLPGRGADRGARGQDRGAGDRVARSAVGRPARRGARGPAVWSAGP
jgi:tRNA(Ile)-lysidine synthase